MCGSGKKSMTTAWLGARKSTHILMLPFFFLTTTIGETHSDAFILSMMPWRSSLKISSETASRRLMGRRRSLDCTGGTFWRTLTVCVWFRSRPSSDVNKCSNSSNPRGSFDVSCTGGLEAWVQLTAGCFTFVENSSTLSVLEDCDRKALVTSGDLD